MKHKLQVLYDAGYVDVLWDSKTGELLHKDPRVISQFKRFLDSWIGYETGDDFNNHALPRIEITDPLHSEKEMAFVLYFSHFPVPNELLDYLLEDGYITDVGFVGMEIMYTRQSRSNVHQYICSHC